MKRILLSAFAALSLSGLSALADPMEVTPLSIVTNDAVHEFTVEVANDGEEISFGSYFQACLPAAGEKKF